MNTPMIDKKKVKFSVINITLTAMFVALMAICSWISIPLVVPITLQTFALFVTLGLLGGIRGTIAITIFILLGLAGVPVFASFNAGLGYLMGPTGGFVFGFILVGITYIILELFIKKRLILFFTACTIGLILCYTMGSLWFYFVYSSSKGSITFLTVLSTCVFPFIGFDIAKMILAYLITFRLYKYVPGRNIKED